MSVGALKQNAAATKAAKSATKQTERTPGRSDEVRNNAGGFTFKASDQTRLERFLILGTDGATYYVNAKDQTDKAVGFLTAQIASNEHGVIDTIIDVSANGRAYKNTPAIFALALVVVNGKDKDYLRQTDAVNKVVRTSTHLFEFANFVDAFGGWGRAKRNLIAGWYTSKTAEQLAYQAVKYRRRAGWTHRDLFRKVHPVGVDPVVGNFILGRGGEGYNLAVIDGFQRMQKAGSVKEVVAILNEYKNLPWETIPTQFLNDVAVWKTLFYNGQLNGQSLVRNITRIAKMDGFADMSFAADYAARLVDPAMIERTKLHPINYLNAAVVYDEGQVSRTNGWYSYGRNKSWTSESVIVDALNDGFYESFKHVEPAGKRTMLAIDVSGSMASPAMGLDLSCAQVSGAIAMTVARTEPAHIIRGFTTGQRGGTYWGRGRAELTDLGISAKTRLSGAMQRVQHHNFGGTDCAQPMLWALENKVDVDTFVVLTDSETWAGQIKPTQALQKYRNATGINARLAVFGIAGNDFTIANPQDSGQMDFVGCDSNAPKVLADFSAGRI